MSMPVFRVLVVDDEANLRELLRNYLAKEGFVVHLAGDGPEAIAGIRQYHPDVVILDVMLPHMDGYQVLQEIRKESDVYVLMLTARSEEMDKVMGLTMGADDFLTKPFSPRELVARIRALQRRSRAPLTPEASKGKDERGVSRELCFENLRIDPARREVNVGPERVELTALEFDLLLALASYPGIVLTREQLIEKVWGYDFYGDERVVDVHVKELRKKLYDTQPPRLIKTIRGVGYKLEVQGDEV